MHRHSRLWLALACVIASGESNGQVRGVYPAGMNVTNGGVAPAPGFAYSNLFIVNSRDERVGAEGETLATGQQSVLLYLNVDSTHFTTLFGGTDSLKSFWRNLAAMK